MDLPPPPELGGEIRQHLEAPNYATLGTVGADGEPHQAVIWYRLEPDGTILVNSRSDRRWPRELRADPRCSLAVVDRADPMRWVGVQGVVESIVDDVEAARDHIVELAQRYDDATAENVARFRSQPRISFRIRIVRLHAHLDD